MKERVFKSQMQTQQVFFVVVLLQPVRLCWQDENCGLLKHTPYEAAHPEHH